VISTLKSLAVAAAAAVIVSTGAVAEQRVQWPSEAFAPPPAANTAGVFDYYVLVLSWSPTYCSGSGEDDETQCDRSDGKRYAFVLHGLWPQYEKGYPDSCRTQRRPFVPQATIDGMLDVMPNSGLVVHEYRKHGTCSGMMPIQYFTLARQLYNSIRIPEQYINPFEAQVIAPTDMINDFVRANPKLKPNMISVACGGQGNRLKEVHICFSKEGQPRSCGSNEDQRQMCATQRMLVPPVRSTARQDLRTVVGPRDSTASTSKPVPRPRLIEMPNGRDE
jgi:ribonuclease T2